MKKIYKLDSNVGDHSSFLQDDYDTLDESIRWRLAGQEWLPLKEKYEPVKLKLSGNDFGKKNFKFDISSSLTPFYIFSENALTCLGDILKPRGQILPVITESKRKNFFGYYPTNPISGCLDMERSKYREYEKGIVIQHCILIEKNITDEYLFTLDAFESVTDVFVTEKFKERVEEAGLVGFDFSRVIEIS